MSKLRILALTEEEALEALEDYSSELGQLVNVALEKINSLEQANTTPWYEMSKEDYDKNVSDVREILVRMYEIIRGFDFPGMSLINQF